MKKLIVSLSLFASINAVAADQQPYCHTDVILKNLAATRLTVTLGNGTSPSWDPIWSNTSLLPGESTNSTMTYLNEHGTPPQFNSQFIVLDNQGGECTFSPWLVSSCDVIWNWQCSPNARFKPEFLHLKRNSWRIDDLSPWIIKLENN